MDAQALMNLIRANEEAPDFDMGNWISHSVAEPCGTFGCLWGNYCLSRCGGNPAKANTLATGLGADDYCSDVSPFSLSTRDLGITLAEAVFLFSYHELRHTAWGISMFRNHEGSQPNVSPKHRPKHDRNAAINRVRKFLYYKLHKRELCYEDDGRVKESARRTEGDHHVARRVLSQLTPA